jgi:hypothetical protein
MTILGWNLFSSTRESLETNILTLPDHHHRYPAVESIHKNELLKVAEGIDGWLRPGIRRSGKSPREEKKEYLAGSNGSSVQKGEGC